MAGALATACGHSAALLLLLATLGLSQRLHPEPGPRGLQHSYDCGVKGMQLLVFPESGQAIHFKVVGECQRSPRPHLPSYSGELGPFPCGRTGSGGPFGLRVAAATTTSEEKGGRLVPDLDFPGHPGQLLPCLCAWGPPGQHAEA